MVGWQRGTTGTAQRKQAAVRGVPSISRRFIHFQQGLKPGLTGIRTTRLFLLLCIDPLLNRLAVSLSVAQWSWRSDAEWYGAIGIIAGLVMDYRRSGALSCWVWWVCYPLHQSKLVQLKNLVWKEEKEPSSRRKPWWGQCLLLRQFNTLEEMLVSSHRLLLISVKSGVPLNIAPHALHPIAIWLACLLLLSFSHIQSATTIGVRCHCVEPSRNFAAQWHTDAMIYQRHLPIRI